MPPFINSTPPAYQTSFFDPFVYQVLATGNPRSFSATGLPDGVAINSTTGLISGTPRAPGTYAVTVSATNERNEAGTQNFTLTVAPPPAGATAQQGSTGPLVADLAVKAILINPDGSPVGASAGGAGQPTPVILQPNPATQSNDDGTNVGTSTAVVLPARAGRLNAEFVNYGTGACFLALGPTATAGKGIYLAPNGGSYSIDSTNLYRGPVSAITATGTTQITMHEGF